MTANFGNLFENVTINGDAKQVKIRTEQIEFRRVKHKKFE